MIENEPALKEMSDQILLELSEIMVFCKECEHQVEELLKVANCIFNRDEFYDLVEGYCQFVSNMTILENLLDQVSYPMTLLQIVAVRTMMMEIGGDFNRLIEMLEIANFRIDEEHIDFEQAKLIQKLLTICDFDVIEYDDLEQIKDEMYLITRFIKIGDEMHDEKYYPLNVLRIEAFSTKAEAYKYALEHGISRSQIVNKYGACLT